MLESKKIKSKSKNKLKYLISNSSFYRLATKLTKVVEDKRKSEGVPLGKSISKNSNKYSYLKIGVRSAARDSENENLLGEYRNKISELSEQNKLLKQRVILSQQQVQAAQQMKKSTTIYDGVSSRIDTVKQFSE